MEYERTISGFGGSTGLTLPHDLLKYLGLKRGDTIIVTDEIGKYGPYITVWKKGDRDVKNTKRVDE